MSKWSWVPLVPRTGRKTSSVPRVGTSGAGHSTGVSGAWRQESAFRPGSTGFRIVGKAGGTTPTRESLEAPTVEIPLTEVRAMMQQDEARWSRRMEEADTGEIPAIRESGSQTVHSDVSSSKKSGSIVDGSPTSDARRAPDVATYAAPVYMVPSRPGSTCGMGNVGRDELRRCGSGQR